MSAVDRFTAKVRAIPCGGCWEFTGYCNPDGYGHFWSGTRDILAHRWAYEQFVGPIPDGLVIDHLCRNPACVNPVHLEAVTQGDNVRRGVNGSATRLRHGKRTHCASGHEFTPENSRYYHGKDGYTVRRCKACDAAAARARRARQRAILGGDR